MQVVGLLQRLGLNADDFLCAAIGIVLVLVALQLILQSFREQKAKISLQRSQTQKVETVLWGAAVGFLVGFTSVGSGSLIAPFLMAVYRLSPTKVVGTDIFHAAMLVTAAAGIHAGIGTVEWDVVLLLLIGSVPGVLLGSYLVPRMPPRALRMGLAIVLLASGIKLV